MNIINNCNESGDGNSNLVWREGLERDNLVEMSSLGWVLIQYE